MVRAAKITLGLTEDVAKLAGDLAIEEGVTLSDPIQYLLRRERRRRTDEDGAKGDGHPVERNG